MDLSKFQIETDRLLIKSVDIEYAEQIFSEYREPVTKYMNYGSPESLDVLKERISQRQKDMTEGSLLQVVLLDKTSEEFLGVFSLEDLEKKQIEMGGWLKTDAWGKGYGREAASALKEWSDHYVDYENIIWPCVATNFSSRKVAESLGGNVEKEYEKTTASGNTWQYVEYWIPKDGICIQEVKAIFQKYALPEPNFVKKIEVGFTNKVYSVNDAYILKICTDENNEDKIEREVYFYNLFSEDIPVPRVAIYDVSKQILKKCYVVYPMIQGENLYNIWHKMSDSERREIVRQLCTFLKLINEKSYDEFVSKFGIDISVAWRDIVLQKIEKSLSTIEEKKILSKEIISHIRGYVSHHQDAINEERMGLVHWDAHFDNVLVRDGRIVGLLDFERTEISSIDFVLDIVKRMQEYPSKYMSEYAEQFAKNEDYANLLDWFKEYYPELFQFDRLDARLGLYSIQHDLDTLIWYPEAQEVKDAINKIIQT